MAKLPSKFDANDHEEQGSYDALPAGDYEVRISGNKMKDNKAKIAAAEQGKVIDGTVYTIIFEVSSGQYKGRLFFMGLNLAHTSAQTVDIANRELGGIVRSCGKSTLKDDDLDDLIDDELVVTVAVVPATAQYPASNKIKSSKPLKGVAKPTPSAAKSPKPKVSFD